MKTIYIACGIFAVFPILTALWFAWLHKHGKLIEKVPPELEDLF